MKIKDGEKKIEKDVIRKVKKKWKEIKKVRVRDEIDVENKIIRKIEKEIRDED